MRRKHLLIAGAVAALLALAACTPSTGTGTPPPTEPVSAPSIAAPLTATGQATEGTDAADPDEATAQGTLVRFTSGQTAIDVTIAPDNPTAKDFVALLPVTVAVTEFAGREKLGTLPRELVTAGSPGSDPEDGDLIYFIPWGNVGFYYNTDGIGDSDQTIHLGTYNATAEELAQLEGSNITVEIVK